MVIHKETGVVFKKYRRLSYPLNLLSVVFEKRFSVKDLPEDSEQRLEFVFQALDPHQRKILDCYFKKHLGLQSVGKIFGISQSTARECIVRIIYFLRKPSCKIILERGIQDACLLTAADSEYAIEEDLDLSSSIYDLNLNTRSYYCLRRAHVDTIRELIGFSKDDLLKFQGLGFGCLNEIEKKLAVHGFSLKD